MNWTGGKRNKIKVKLELQKQREFFNRQRLKKVHSLLNTEPSRTRTLPSIDVVRRSGTLKNNSISDTSDLSNRDRKSLPISLDFQHYKRHARILDRDNDNIDLGSKDIAKSKQFLLQDNDWAGVGSSLATDMEKSQNNEYESDSPLCINAKIDVQTDVNNTNSFSSTQNTTVTQESLEWHQFLTSNSTPTNSIINDNQDFIESAVQHISSLNDFNSKIEHESPFSQTKTIATTALHSVTPESITASNIEWNKFIQPVFSENVNKDLNVISFIHSPYLNSANHFNGEVTKENRLCDSNCKDNSEPSAIITSANDSSKMTQGYSIDKMNLKEPLSTGSNTIIDQEVLKRIHDLEINNARLQLEISFLRNDVKWLMKIIKKNEAYTKSSDENIHVTNDIPANSTMPTPQHLTGPSTPIKEWDYSDDFSESLMSEMSFIDSPTTRVSILKRL